MSETSLISLTTTKKEERVCICCGETFYEYPYIDKEFCNKCYPVVIRNVFNKDNGNLTCSQVKDKIRKELGMEK